VPLTKSNGERPTSPSISLSERDTCVRVSPQPVIPLSVVTLNSVWVSIPLNRAFWSALRAASRGLICMAEDFDELPADLTDAFHGEDEGRP